MKKKVEKPKVKKGQTWRCKDKREGNRTIVIKSKLPTGRWAAESHNLDSYSAKQGSKSGVTRIEISERTILSRFTLEKA